MRPLALLLLAAAAPLCAETTLRSEVDARRVGKDDQVELTITIEGSSLGPGDEVGLPALQNLRVVGGPAVSTQMSIVNGAISQARSYTWVLQPVAVGRAEIGVVRVRLAEGEKTAPAIAIEVAPGSVKPRRERRADPFFEADPLESVFGPRRPLGPEPKLFVEASPSRKQLHVGEPLVVTYYVYTQASVTDLQFTEAPQYPGFWVEELDKARAVGKGERVSSGGEQYTRFPVGERLLFPTRAGRLTIPLTTVRLRLAPRGFFDRGGVVERRTKPVEIEAQAIPEEPGFSGAVGRFRASASLDRRALPLGEAATLRFRVEGTGNLKWVDRGPEVVVAGAKVYPPQSRSDLAAERTGLTGSRTWEYVIVPETRGDLEVPRLAFSYFDPEARRTVRAETAAIPLKVEGGASAGAGPAPAPALRRAGSLALRADLDVGRAALPILGGRAVAFLTGGVLLLHGAIWASGRLGEVRRLRSGRVAPRRSVKSALQELDRAGRAGMSKEAAAAVIEKTMHELFGPVEEDGTGLGDRERAARAVLEEVHFVRYAPQLGDYSEKIRELAERAQEVVRKWA